MKGYQETSKRKRVKTINNMIYILPAILLCFLLGVYLITTLKTMIKENNDDLIEQREHLEQEIERMTKIIETKSIDKSVSLSKAVTRTLDIYDQSHIRIPVDIIEDLSYIDFENEQEIFAFIEIQRNYWKLENSKKVFRRKGN